MLPSQSACLPKVLKDIEHKNRFELIGLSGTSAGALCALMTWYDLAPTGKRNGSPNEAIRQLDHFRDEFVATTGPETLLNFFTFGLMGAEEWRPDCWLQRVDRQSVAESRIVLHHESQPMDWETRRVQTH
jgi:hypothetical protein